MGDNQRKTVQAMPAVSVTSRVAPPRFRLVYPGGDVLLGHGVVVIGRDPDCDIPVDDPLASRHHVRVTTDQRGTTVADLASINGTWVNGERVDAPRLVAAGDKLLVGEQELSFVDARASGTRVATPAAPLPATLALASSRPSSERSPRPPAALTPSHGSPRMTADSSPPSPRLTPDPLPRQTPDPLARMPIDPALRITSSNGSPLEAGPGRAQVETTGRVDAFELLGALADKAFALGQNDRAAELVGPYLRNILRTVRDGGSVSAETSTFVARYAVKIAAATGDPQWIEVALELFTLTKTLLPAAVVGDLATLRTRLAINRPALRRYVDVLRASVVRFDAAEHILLQRIAGLDPLASSDRR